MSKWCSSLRNSFLATQSSSLVMKIQPGGTSVVGLRWDEGLHLTILACLYIFPLFFHTMVTMVTVVTMVILGGDL
jgi:hypothetical protein